MAGVAAQTVVVVHLAYLLYVLLGGLLGMRNIHWLWPHAVTAFWGVVGLVTQVRCPLTVLEKYLLTLDGTEPYSGTFIGNHVAGVFYPAAWQALDLVLDRRGRAHELRRRLRTAQRRQAPGPPLKPQRSLSQRVFGTTRAG